jgi:hypothetical protein
MKTTQWALACKRILMNTGTKFGLFLFRGMRAAAALTWALYGVVMSGLTLAQAQDRAADIAQENRLTKMESRSEQIWEEVKTIRADLKDAAKLNYIAVIGTSGLLGEMGIRIVQRRKKKEEDGGEPA